MGGHYTRQNMVITQWFFYSSFNKCLSFSNPHPRICWMNIREWERGRERERDKEGEIETEKHASRASHVCPNQRWKQQPSGVWTGLQPSEPPGQDYQSFSWVFENLYCALIFVDVYLWESWRPHWGRFLAGLEFATLCSRSLNYQLAAQVPAFPLRATLWLIFAHYCPEPAGQAPGTDAWSPELQLLAYCSEGDRTA